MSDFEALRQLLGAYLNQDWPADYPTVWDAVADFVRNEPDLLPEVRTQVAEIIAAGMSEEELRDLVIDKLGSGYWPPATGVTFSEWLIHLLDHLY